MRHHRHCGIKEHFNLAHVKKLGIIGIIIFVLHILFHIAELLIIPLILAWLGGK